MFRIESEEVSGGVPKELDSLGIPGMKVLTAPGVKEIFSRDQADLPPLVRSVLFRTEPMAVVQASNVEAVSAVMRFVSKKGVPIIPRGTGSSPFGGSMPVIGGIVLDISVLDKIIEIDERAMTIKVQAGARWGDVDWALEEKGLGIMSCPSSRFSTVGGWIATGGVGVESFMADSVSDSIVELEVVLPNGDMATLMPGDPMLDMLTGSEGRLAVIVGATLKVKPRRKLTPRLFLFNSTENAIDFAEKVASSEIHPDDIVYYHEAKFSHLNKIMGKPWFSEAPGVLVTGHDLGSSKELKALVREYGDYEQKDHRAQLAWNERFFPMKFRLLGPGLLGAEVVVDKEHFKSVVKAAENTARLYGLEPIMESHFVKNGDRLVLCYFVTDQTRQVRYMMDAVRSLLIMTAMVDAGARAYSTGLWNHVFLDEGDVKHRSREETKKRIDPKGTLNPGKGKRLAGSLGGLPASALSPSMAPIFRLLNQALPVVGAAMSALQGLEGMVLGRPEIDDVVRSANICAMCGACVAVCPAYQATKDERVTARGKMLTARMLTEGREVTKEHAHMTSLCMRCRACEQVCQSKLDLIPLYERLEAKLEKMHGSNPEEVARFIQYVEVSPEYQALLDKGLVIGAPRTGMDRRDTNV